MYGPGIRIRSVCHLGTLLTLQCRSPTFYEGTQPVRARVYVFQQCVGTTQIKIRDQQRVLLYPLTPVTTDRWHNMMALRGYTRAW